MKAFILILLILSFTVYGFPQRRQLQFTPGDDPNNFGLREHTFLYKRDLNQTDIDGNIVDKFQAWLQASVMYTSYKNEEEKIYEVKLTYNKLNYVRFGQEGAVPNIKQKTSEREIQLIYQIKVNIETGVIHSMLCTGTRSDSQINIDEMTITVIGRLYDYGEMKRYSTNRRIPWLQSGRDELVSEQTIGTVVKTLDLTYNKDGELEHCHAQYNQDDFVKMDLISQANLDKPEISFKEDLQLDSSTDLLKSLNSTLKMEWDQQSGDDLLPFNFNLRVQLNMGEEKEINDIKIIKEFHDLFTDKEFVKINLDNGFIFEKSANIEPLTQTQNNTMKKILDTKESTVFEKTVMKKKITIKFVQDFYEDGNKLSLNIYSNNTFIGNIVEPMTFLCPKEVAKNWNTSRTFINMTIPEFGNLNLTLFSYSIPLYGLTFLVSTFGIKVELGLNAAFGPTQRLDRTLGCRLMVEPYIMPLLWGRGGVSLAGIAEAGVQVQGLFALTSLQFNTSFYSVLSFPLYNIMNKVHIAYHNATVGGWIDQLNSSVALVHEKYMLKNKSMENAFKDLVKPQLYIAIDFEVFGTFRPWKINIDLYLKYMKCDWTLVNVIEKVLSGRWREICGYIDPPNTLTFQTLQSSDLYNRTLYNITYMYNFDPFNSNSTKSLQMIENSIQEIQ